MKNKKNIVLLLVWLLLIVLIYKEWFSSGLITAGDFWPYFKSTYATRPVPLTAWDINGGYGLGGFSGPFLWIHLNLSTPITLLGRYLGLSWAFIERVWYLYPFLILIFVSPFILFRKLFPDNKFVLISVIIFSLNTYILMIIGGGQIAGVGMAYIITPLVLWSFYSLLNEGKLKFVLLAGLLFGVQIIFDLRLAYISFFAIFLLYVLNWRAFLRKGSLFNFCFALIISFALNLFWIIPTVVVHQNPIQALGSAYGSVDAVRFFSFAKLENALALMHPNWPENIFGKVGFMKSEFQFIPILAFIALIFCSKEKSNKVKKTIIFFSLVSLAGAFLAKGANEPFGNLYLFLFNTIPGFQMYRDPTKWYLLVAVSYSVLIPFAIHNTYILLKSKFPKYYFLKQLDVSNVFAFVVVFYLFFLIKPALFGELQGAFKTNPVPVEYGLFEKRLSSDHEFYRTFWIPDYQRFSFYSNAHPSMSGNNFLHVASPLEAARKINEESTKNLLQQSGVRYVVVPYDSSKEIFLKDRKYDDVQRSRVIQELKKVVWLKEKGGFGRLAVFESTSYKPHFWSTSSNISVNSIQKNSTHYTINVRNAQKGDQIIFSESFDPQWIAKDGTSTLLNKRYQNLFNGFALVRDGDYSLTLIYTPQKLVVIGEIASLIALVATLLCLARFFIKKND